jgi:hypothetical protein
VPLTDCFPKNGIVITLSLLTVDYFYHSLNLSLATVSEAELNVSELCHDDAGELEINLLSFATNDSSFNGVSIGIAPAKLLH